MFFAPFESENGYRLRIFNKVLSRWQKLWSRWRKKKLTPNNAWKFAHALCCLVPRPHSFGEMQGCCVWLWWLNNESYSELRQDFLVFQEQNFADPRFVFCGNCSHVICRRLFVGGEFMWNSQGIVENPLGFAHSRLELGRNFERDLQECMNICHFNSKWIRKEDKYMQIQNGF